MKSVNIKIDYLNGIPLYGARMCRIYTSRGKRFLLPTMNDILFKWLMHRHARFAIYIYIECDADHCD